MVCIYCCGTTQVSNSRPQKRTNTVWRRRRCNTCSAVFTSEESAQYDAAWLVTQPSGAVEPFSRDRLLISLHKSLGHRKTAIADAGGLVDTVIKKLLADSRSNGTIDVTRIVQIVLVALNRFDKAAASHYQAFHRV